MSDVKFSNKRIAKNTIFLYSRTLLVMLVSLYTSRVVLGKLGVVDYGIYNVVGGVVMMFSFITTTLSSASQRYIAFELPNKNTQKLRETFSLILLSFSVVVLLTFIIAEVVGLWFLNSHLNIPHYRLTAANWVLQTTIISFMLQIITAPYMAMVIAHERMGAYAYISMIDVILKLISVYVLQVVNFDSLIVYAFLMLLCTTIVTYIYRFYCKSHYQESHFLFFYEKERLKDFMSYAMWSMFGPIASVIKNQGVNILLNLFFGPTVNAACAISNQVKSSVVSFSSNFFTAMRPQITMCYSSGNESRMKFLITSGSRLSFYLLLIVSLPILFNTESILELWLLSYPKYSVVFVKIVLLISLLEVFNTPLVAGLIATGKIKIHQQVTAAIYILNLPISILLLKLEYGPEVVFYVNAIMALVSYIPRVYLCKLYYNLNVLNYFTIVLLRCLFVFIICYILGLITNTILSNMLVGFATLRLVMSILIIVFWVLLVEYLIGINNEERSFVKSRILNIVKK